MIIDFHDRTDGVAWAGARKGRARRGGIAEGLSDCVVERLHRRATERLCARERAMRLNIRNPRPGDVIVTTDDGVRLRDHVFDHPPSLAELLERAGPRAVVVTMRQQRRSLRQRLLPAFLGFSFVEPATGRYGTDMPQG